MEENNLCTLKDLLALKSLLRYLRGTYSQKDKLGSHQMNSENTQHEADVHLPLIRNIAWIWLAARKNRATERGVTICPLPYLSLPDLALICFCNCFSSSAASCLINLSKSDSIIWVLLKVLYSANAF